MAKRFKVPDGVHPYPSTIRRIKVEMSERPEDSDTRTRVMIRLVRAAQRAPTEALHSALNYLRDYE